MTRWFRVYSDMVDDPKVQRLPAETFRGLVNLWCLAARSDDGRLPPIDDIAFSLRVAPRRAHELLAELRTARLIDDEVGDEGNVTRPHNWQARQFKSDVSKERVKRHRQRQRNVTSTVTGAVSVTPPETETETEQKEPLASRETREDEPPDIPAILRRPLSPKPDAPDYQAEFDQRFWRPYPHKVGKPAAFKAFVRARKSFELDAILFGLAAYVAQKPPDRPWLNPATFLNQERFNDQPASTANEPRANGKPSPHDALLRAVAERFAPGPGLGGGAPDADGGLFDQPGPAAPDRGEGIELAAGDYRRHE